MSWYREEYLKSGDWKNLRNAILAYQDHTCESCGEKATDVHHLIYRKIFDVTHFDLMALCRPCHTSVHEWLMASKDDPKQRKRIAYRAGLSLKSAIAIHVSPRGFVRFKCCFGKCYPSTQHIVTFHKDKSKSTVERLSY